jgi:hypothetical protein
LVNESDPTSLVATRTTAADGKYAFQLTVPVGSYRLVEVPPSGRLSR